MKHLLFAAAGLALSVFGPQVTSGTAVAAVPVVAATKSGQVRGSVDGDVLSFKGVPFAAPPVGDLRWRAPQPPKAWSGVREATSFGPDCMQIPFGGDAAPLGTTPSEDCLYVNVWRPAAETKEQLPVLVWIYGGGFVNGGASPDVYDGSAFAKKGVVFVSFNYRLGRFGFFAHPALTAAAGDEPVGNYGYMDQVAALKWVRENIANFGGDPDRVTLFGESAGGGSVLSMMTSPAAKGLFHAAMVMSGGGRALLRTDRKLNVDQPGAPSAETLGLEFAKEVGVEGSGPEALRALRALPPEKVIGGINLESMFRGTLKGPPPGPFIDGKIVTGPQQDALEAGTQAQIPVIAGYTSADIGFVMAPDKDQLFAKFGDKADLARKLYDPTGTSTLPAVMMEVGRDQTMAEPARYIASRVAAAGHPAWMYRFSYVAESMRSQWQGTPHATEIPFFLNTVKAKYGDGLTAADSAAAEAANAYLANFVRSHDPNGSGLPEWPRYDDAKREGMDFTLEGPVGGPDPWRERLDLIEGLANAGTPGGGGGE